METTATEPRGTLGAQVAQLKGKISLKQTDRERSAELTALKADDLRKIAKDLGLTGYSSKKKDELVAAIVTDEIAKELIVVAQPDMPAAESAKISTNGNGTNGNGTAHAAPAANAKSEIKVGDEMFGTVSGINFSVGGMFVTLGEKSGLAHCNQIGLEGESKRATMRRLDAAFKIGDTVAVRVTRVGMNEARGKLEIALELVGESRELFKNTVIAKEQEQTTTGGDTAGNGGNAGTSDTATEAAGASNQPVQRQTSPDDEVMFRALAVSQVVDIILTLDIERVVDEGLRRSGGSSRQKVYELRETLRAAREKGTDVLAGLAGFKQAVWDSTVFSRENAANVAYKFVGIAFGCLPGLSRQMADALKAALEPFVNKSLSSGERAFDFSDIVRKEIEVRKQAAAETRADRARATVDTFDMFSSGRPKPLAKDTQAAGKKLEQGAVYDGKVVNAAEFGVFVTLTGEHEGQKGLVHVSVMGGNLRPGTETQARLNEKNPTDTVVRVKFIQRTDKGIELQFEEDAATVKAEPRAERGRYPRVGDLHSTATVIKIGAMGDTIVVGFDGYRGAIYVGDIGWPVPRSEADRVDSKARLAKTFPDGREICVEVIHVERKPDRQNIMRDRFGLKAIPPEEYARRKGGGQGGGASRPATAAKPGADGDKEAERATAIPASAEQEERRETVEVDIDTITGQPVECRQDPDSGTCSVHTNGHPVTMMPGEHFCAMGRELIRQGGVPVEKEEMVAAPATDGEVAVAVEVTRRGDGNVPSFVVNAVTLKALRDFLGDQEMTADDIETLGEIWALALVRTLLTREQAWAEKERMIGLARKYGANEKVMDLVVRRSYGTVEQVDRDVHYADGRAFKARLESAGTEFMCMAEGLGGHKTPWFIGAGRTNQLHPELGAILLRAIPDRSPARLMATRIQREAEDGLPLCLRCADLRLGWVAELLSENGLIPGEALGKLLDICPASNSGRRHQVFTYISREPHQRVYQAYEAALAQKEGRLRAAEAAKDPAPKPDDSAETARAKRAVRSRQGGAFHMERDEEVSGNGGEPKPSTEPKPCTGCTQPTLRADRKCNDCRRNARKAAARTKAAPPKKDKKGGDKSKNGGKKK